MVPREHRTQQSHLLDDRRHQVVRQERRPQGHLPLLLLRREDRRPRPQRLGQELRCCASSPASTRTSTGRSRSSPGYTIGFLEQEPQLDETKTVRADRRGGRRGRRSSCSTSSTRSTTSSASRIVGPTRWRSCSRSRASSRRRSTHQDAWDLDQQLEMAMDALRCPPRRDAGQRRSPAARSAASRCAGCCCRSRTSCCSTSRPTTSTPRASRGSSSTCSATRARSSPSRTTATSSTTSPAGSSSSTAAQGIPWKGNYSSLARAEAGRGCAVEEKHGDRAGRRRSSASWNGSACRPSARQAKSKARLNAYEAMLAEDASEKEQRDRDLHPAGPAARRARHRGRQASPRATATSCCSRT